MKPTGIVLKAKEWEVKPITHEECKTFIEEYHYSHSCSRTHVVSHGLFRKGVDKLQGAILWLPPTPNAARSVCEKGDDWRNVITCSRLAVHPEVPTNGASFLLGQSMKQLDVRWEILLTYADTRLGHTGAIYKATNWTCLGEVKAGDVWLDDSGKQRGRKRGGRNLTVQEMKDLGFTKVPQLPKIKYVYRRLPPNTTNSIIVSYN